MEQFPAKLRKRIDESIDLVREVSVQTDPQEMVRRFRDRMAKINPRDASISISRRDLEHPCFRVTRASTWREDVNPWKQPERLPQLCGGLAAELLYGNKPQILRDPDVKPDDPVYPYLNGMRSVVAVPLFDNGESLNMVLFLHREPDGLDIETIPDLIITSNLFGRATHYLVLADKLRAMNEEMDAEFRAIAAIQRSLLPPSLNVGNGLDLAAHYATARRAGGDYYDVFPQSDGRTGILIADVSGHGAAAAVVMARIHAAMHAFAGDRCRPDEVLRFANEHLLLRCRSNQTVTTFATAFYAVHDPAARSFTFSSAGHNPPLLRRADGAICSISGARQFPLGIECGLRFEQGSLRLQSGDCVLLYTDGIVEAANPRGEIFGLERLSRVVADEVESADALIRRVVDAVDRFLEGRRADDDRTLLAVRIP